MRVNLAAQPVGKKTGFAVGYVFGAPATVFPAVNETGHLTRRPSFFINVFGLYDLFDEAYLVVRIQNGEIGAQVDQLGMTAQNPHRYRVKGAQPPHAFNRLAHQRTDALFHLARGFIGKGHSQNLARPSLSGGDFMGNACGQCPCFAGAGTGQQQKRAVFGQNSRALLVIKAVQHRPNAARIHIGAGGSRD